MSGPESTGDVAVGVLARVGELLAGLSAADVAALADGRARLVVAPVTPPRDVPDRPVGPTTSAPSGVDLAAASATLDTFVHRRDGTAYLTPWAMRDLRALAAGLGLRGVAGLRKAELVERLVDRTIGFRAASAAVRAR
ncbi:Rho termination factor N-terminal domain-containing protein [Micromonospora sp. HUAS LYJ1]|uniref:Rho termination factor N-terminal domain-containing protein n=1 Tax=Micromonospora sp. HUAS LYJ1 TaxID=3061626 RepID=UPI0026731074|nr:Rho termination factor N-terminal domain-containing protein [Micromonospora sp. HUAS LYJ1]WKU04372.1 Rho termination factor N-terminal domain-containing protein [Micromonospora sp. HUAS LYJ1]